MAKMQFRTGILQVSTVALAAAMSACSGDMSGGTGAGTTTDPNAVPGTPGQPGTPGAVPGAVDPTTGQPVVDPTTGQPVVDPTTDPNMQMPTTPVNTPGVPPTSLCDGQLPGSFTTTCSGCHTKGGTANSRYPDLFNYVGTVDDFKAKVRAGGNGMAPYSAAIIADADLEAIFAFFTGTERGALDTVNLGGVVPLFSEADGQTNPPIVFTRDDGVLITRGAGRVRGRHEGPQDTNQPFMEWVTDYFVDRTYGWIVEDYTTAGESRIAAYYLPIGQPTGGTNFRAWKNYDNGDVFSTNGGMDGAAGVPSLAVGGVDYATDYQNNIAPFAAAQVGETTSNTRDGGSITAGQMFEFEFGVFLSVPGRTAYYTDTFRYQVGTGGVTSNNPDMYDGMGTLGPLPQAQLAGSLTNVWAYWMEETQFGQQALNIQHENMQNFAEGRRLFHTDFVTGEHSEGANPAMDQMAGLAGPLFQTTSCENCHIHNGPGEMLQGSLDETSSMAFKLHGSATLGNQLQLQEGAASFVAMETKDVTLGDGTVVTLSKPTYSVDVHPQFSARMSRKVIGVGLLEAIDERTILGRADMTDCNADGITGRPNFITDPGTGDLRIGRLGWKAEKVSVAHQVADALEGDIGVGTTLIPDSAGNIELQDADFMDLVTYMRLVTVPGQRTPDDPTVMQGEALFKTVGCSSCHVTDVVTGPNHPFRELQNQSIKPFTDLLLHDMGEDLADNSGVPVGVAESDPAGASEWRTPPLWGTGMLATINGHTGLLHDGRAASVLEAVLWHGGEAAMVRDRFIALSAAERDALLAFVNSL